MKDFFTKRFTQGDQDVSWNGEPLSSLVVKSAGVTTSASPLFTKEVIQKHWPDDRHFMMHVIAMGDQEYYGFNRNGDGFPAKMLEKRAHTFVTHGHMFREHNNKDPKFAIGTIKAAAYCPVRHRVEVLLHGDKEKAEEEYEMAKAGKELSFSMSVKIDYDVCSCCEKKSSHQQFYCDHLRNHMKEYLPEFEKYAFAINPNGTFFDLSRVRKPADRTAHYVQYYFSEDNPELAKKSASCGVCEKTPDNPFLTGIVRKKIKIIVSPAERDVAGCLAKQIVPDNELQHIVNSLFGGGLSRLSERGIILPFLPFLSWATRRPMSELIYDPMYTEAVPALGAAEEYYAGDSDAAFEGPDIVDEVLAGADKALSPDAILNSSKPAVKIQITVIKSASSKGAKALSLYSAYKSFAIKNMPFYLRDKAMFISAARDLYDAAK